MFAAWLTALEARHLANLRVPEVTRALRALSSAYVERRHKVTAGATLDSAGKRAAFALYYAPLHYLVVDRIVHALQTPAPESILDIGCGTGRAGAAWALATGGQASVLGIDRHPWAADEARWTYRQLGIRGRAHQGDVAGRLPTITPRTGVMAAYVLNELPEESRAGVETQLLWAATSGAQVLIVEPIARGVAPWWNATAARVIAAGGRVDEWRFPIELPPLLQLFDQAAGLNHRELKARSMYLPGAAVPPGPAGGPET